MTISHFILLYPFIVSSVLGKLFSPSISSLTPNAQEVVIDSTNKFSEKIATLTRGEGDIPSCIVKIVPLGNANAKKSVSVDTQFNLSDIKLQPSGALSKDSSQFGVLTLPAIIDSKPSVIVKTPARIDSITFLLAVGPSTSGTNYAFSVTSSFVISDCLFTSPIDSKSDLPTGLIDLNGGKLTASRLSFSTLSLKNPCIYAQASSTLDLTSSSFYSLNCKAAPCCVSASSSTVTLTSVSVLQAVSSVSQGRAILISKCNATVTSCTFKYTEEASSITVPFQCEWSGNAVAIEKSNATINGNTFANLPFGALFINGGSVEMSSNTFKNNTGYSKFPNYERNIYCRGGALLKVQSIAGVADCKTPPSPLFYNVFECNTTESCFTNGADPHFTPAFEGFSYKL